MCAAADAVRRAACGDGVSYVVNRNINYTNVCSYACSFCAFSKGASDREISGAPYVVPLEEVQRRAAEAWERGASEVCLQGGIHPDFTGHTYLSVVEAVKAAAPRMHVHAFSPLEVAHGARTLGLTPLEFLRELKAAGLGSLPGTAAEARAAATRPRSALPSAPSFLWRDARPPCPSGAGRPGPRRALPGQAPDGRVAGGDRGGERRGAQDHLHDHVRVRRARCGPLSGQAAKPLPTPPSLR